MYTVNIIGADGLTEQEAIATAVKVVTYFSRIIMVSTSEELSSRPVLSLVKCLGIIAVMLLMMLKH